MEDITDPGYRHEKIACKDFEIKKLGEHHDFYVYSDTLLSDDTFENFRNAPENISIRSCKVLFCCCISMPHTFTKD